MALDAHAGTAKSLKTADIPDDTTDTTVEMKLPLKPVGTTIGLSWIVDTERAGIAGAYGLC